MKDLIVTKDFQSFVDGTIIETYQEIYDFYQAAIGNDDACVDFRIEQCNGSSDILITQIRMNQGLRLSPKAYAYLPEWIENNMMDGMDSESFWGMKHAKETDELEEKERNAREK